MKRQALPGYSRPMSNRTSFTYPLSVAQQAVLKSLLRDGNYEPVSVPHSVAAVRIPNCNITLFKSGKCLVQGRGAEDFVTFILEPMVLQSAELGYENILDPKATQPHIGVDESGKGDFFGPIVIAAAYIDEALAAKMNEMDVKDSKRITSDSKAVALGRELRRLLGRRCSVVLIGPRAYNRLYSRMRNVNTLLSWAHARAIENLLESVPDCPRAVSDQFGNKKQLEQALMKKGRHIELEQRPKAESDLAVAAASIIAREGFLTALGELSRKRGVKLPKGASGQVREAAVELGRKHGAETLIDTVKCHFKTTDTVLSELGVDRSVLGPEGQAVSKPKTDFRKGASRKPKA